MSVCLSVCVGLSMSVRLCLSVYVCLYVCVCMYFTIYIILSFLSTLPISGFVAVCLCLFFFNTFYIYIKTSSYIIYIIHDHCQIVPWPCSGPILGIKVKTTSLNICQRHPRKNTNYFFNFLNSMLLKQIDLKCTKLP